VSPEITAALIAAFATIAAAVVGAAKVLRPWQRHRVEAESNQLAASVAQADVNLQNAGAEIAIKAVQALLGPLQDRVTQLEKEVGRARQKVDDTRAELEAERRLRRALEIRFQALSHLERSRSDDVDELIECVLRLIEEFTASTGKEPTTRLPATVMQRRRHQGEPRA
jgi:DNA repair ATPase RecN